MSDIHDQIAAALPALSHLECGHCGRREKVDSIAARLRGNAGWPTCCHGHTMNLITEKQMQEPLRYQPPTTSPAPSEH